MVLTSYFANHRHFPDNKKKVSISRITPTWFEADSNDLSLAPSKELLFDYKEGKVNQEEYIRRYKEETLSKLDPFEVAQKHRNSILLCYEKIGDFCHRHIVEEWLDSFGLLCEEVEKANFIAVVGSRHFKDYEYFKKVLTRFLANYKNPTLVSGGAFGADEFAERYAKEYNIPIKIFEADWNNPALGNRAGYARNRTIWENSTVGIAFWDGKSRGTRHSFKLSTEQNKKLYVVEYNTKKIYLNKKAS